MASLLEPPALLTLVVVLVGGAGALYYGLRPALRGPLPVVTSERDEVWGAEDPPPPPKRPYVYPSERPGAVQTPRSDREPEPLAVMPGGPTVAPRQAATYVRPEPVEGRASTSSARTESEVEPEEDDEELSLADLFRPRRRSHAAPNDAPTKD